jgi:alpha,alpha-trehalase
MTEHIQLSGELFELVQRSGIFRDSKTFVDAIPKEAPEHILAQFAELRHRDDFNLANFIGEHFIIPTTAENTEYPLDTSTLERYISSLWPRLRREPADVAPHDTLIPLIHPYIVPGGRFREIYYWDSYFTFLGLAETGDIAMIENMVRNFIHLQDQLGLIPNGNRWYFATRSQPPFLSLMIKLLWERHYAEQPDGLAHISQYLEALEREHAFWLQPERVLPTGHDHQLSRYWDSVAIPRQEAFKEDIAVAERSGRPHEEVYRHLRAAAESGWDFSSRWLADPHDLATIRTTEILPVDLNSLLFALEDTLRFFYTALEDGAKAAHYEALAEVRRTAISELFWHDGAGFFFDYHVPEARHTPVHSLAGVMPLFVGAARGTQAERVHAVIMERFLQAGGLVSTLTETHEQWDSPNGWAPLQWMTVKGLVDYGFIDSARVIAERWLKTVSDNFAIDRKLLEKYDVVEPLRKAGGGEYAVQEGFGWTNGVTVAFKQLLADLPKQS